MRLTAFNVNEVFKDCLFQDEEIRAAGGETPPHIAVDGITMRVGFHPQRLERHRANVSSMLSELPSNFMRENGLGETFLNGCVTSKGEQWGEQRNVDELFMLGMALGVVRSLLPRTSWHMLPGGMPFYVVNTRGFSNESVKTSVDV